MIDRYLIDTIVFEKANYFIFDDNCILTEHTPQNHSQLRYCLNNYWVIVKGKKVFHRLSIFYWVKFSKIPIFSQIFIV